MIAMRIDDDERECSDTDRATWAVKKQRTYVASHCADVFLVLCRARSDRQRHDRPADFKAKVSGRRRRYRALRIPGRPPVRDRRAQAGTDLRRWPVEARTAREE